MVGVTAFDRVITPTGKTLDLLRKYGVAAPIDIIPSGMDVARFDPARHGERGGWKPAGNAACRTRAPLLLNIGRIAKGKEPGTGDARVSAAAERPARMCISPSSVKADARAGAHGGGVGRFPRSDADRAEAVGENRPLLRDGRRVFAARLIPRTQGLTYVEAMASGLCVCAVNDPCLDGVVEDGVSGILSGDSDEQALLALIRVRRGGKRIADRSGSMPRHSVRGLCRKGGSLLS